MSHSQSLKTDSWSQKHRTRLVDKFFLYKILFSKNLFHKTTRVVEYEVHPLFHVKKITNNKSQF